MGLIKTNIRGLDEMLRGGVPEGSVVEVSGVPGSGKTVLCLEFLLRSEDNGLFVSFEQDEKYLRKQMQSLGLPENKKVSFLYLGSYDSDLKSMVDKIVEEVKKTKAKRLVIDSISSLINLYLTPSLSERLSKSGSFTLGGTNIIPIFVSDEPHIRAIVWKVLEGLKKTGCTIFVTSELPRASNYYSRDTVSEFKVDGIILLEKVEMGGGTKNSIKVVKMRYVDHEPDSRQFSIEKSGIKIEKWHRVEEK